MTLFLPKCDPNPTVLSTEATAQRLAALLAKFANQFLRLPVTGIFLRNFFQP